MPKLPLPRVLLVESDPSQRELMLDALARSDFIEGVEACADGEAAVAHVASRAPDSVLLDLDVSSVDGRELLRRIKGAPETRHVPVVLLSDAHDAASVLIAGGADGLARKVRDAEALDRLVFWLVELWLGLMESAREFRALLAA